MISKTYLLLGLAGLAAVGVVVATKKTSASGPAGNPWRGTGTACERDFDAASPDKQKAIADYLYALPAGSQRRIDLAACVKGY